MCTISALLYFQPQLTSMCLLIVDMRGIQKPLVIHQNKNGDFINYLWVLYAHVTNLLLAQLGADFCETVFKISLRLFVPFLRYSITNGCHSYSRFVLLYQTFLTAFKSSEMSESYNNGYLLSIAWNKCS